MAAAAAAPSRPAAPVILNREVCAAKEARHFFVLLPHRPFLPRGCLAAPGGAWPPLRAAPGSPTPCPRSPLAQVAHSATAEQLECLRSMQPFFEASILPLLLPVESQWQPSDFLPSSQDPDEFRHQVGTLWGSPRGL